MCLRFPGLTQSHEAPGRLHTRTRQFGDAGVSLHVSPSNLCGGSGRGARCCVLGKIGIFMRIRRSAAAEEAERL
jgi:hypothetical protein